MTPFVRDAIKRIAIVAAFLCCAIMAAILLYEAAAKGRLAHDYSVYWRTANGPAERAYDPVEFFPFPYAPTMLVWIAPLKFGPLMMGYILLVVAGIGGMILACRPYLSKWAIALTLLSAPMVRCVRNGQVSAFLAALLIWSCGTANRVAAGIALGAIASIKPQLVLMAPLMLALNRDWRAFYAAGGFFLFVALLSLAFGPERWPEWLASMGHFHDRVTNTNVIEIAVTPAAVAQWFGLPTIPFLFAGIAGGAALVYLCRDAEPLEKATAIGAGSLLAAPYALAYDLVVIVPFVAAQVMRGRLWNFVAVTALFHPAPLLIAAYELLARINPHRARRHVSPAAIGDPNRVDV